MLASEAAATTALREESVTKGKAMATVTAAPPRKRSSSARGGSTAWNRFRRNLATALASLANEQFLVVSTKQSNRFVQFARGPSEGGTSNLRVEAVSNEYLAGSNRLTRKQMSALGELGWIAPTHRQGEPRVAHGSPNFYRDFAEPFPLDAIAQVCVDMLRSVYRVRQPGDLEYRSFQEPGGVDVLLPVLEIDQEKRSPPTGDPGYEAARAAVLEAVQKASDSADLQYDQDGDIPVQYGGATLFVRVEDKPRFVRVFSAIATDVPLDEALLRRLNELNAGATFVRFLFVNGRVWASADVFSNPLMTKHVVDACHAVGKVANKFGESLKREFGERTVLPMPNRGAPKN